MIPIYTRRRIINAINLMGSVLAMVFGLFWLFWILLTLFDKGLGGISPAIFTQMTPSPGDSGGLLNAIAGSLVMVMLATLIGTPVGIMAGTYLAEFDQRGWLAPATRFVNDILLSAPSIVIGLFVYTVYVAKVGHFSGWAGALALSLIVIPVVVRTTEDMLRLVPNSLREAAIALGAPQWKVITLVTWRASKVGIMTGILLAVARISGETAPLLFTALNNQFWNDDM
ncbi:MAG: phosphate ABC transporter permease PstA [Gammaproteobacteria bacterium]|nr:MAG: phosphate ABC transporter permease PstA [Gammaproteobacteria bacterium]